jgi:hypothetical protein
VSKGSRSRSARRRGNGGQFLFQLFKAGVLATGVVSVALPDLVSAADHVGDASYLLRESLAFFALTALAILLFPRAKLRDLLAAGLAVAVGLELARLAPALHLPAEPAAFLARLAGMAGALVPVAFGRAFPVQRRGLAPTSFAYLP